MPKKNYVKTQLFVSLPDGAKFRYETPDSGKVFIKKGYDSATHDGAHYTINPGVLVFPLPDLQIWPEVVPPHVGVDFIRHAKVVEVHGNHTIEPVEPPYGSDTDDDEYEQFITGGYE